MNDNNLSQTLQQSFRIAIGAVTSIVETAQNPEKRTEAFSELQMELNHKTREWAAKGENTEIEARKIWDNFLSQQNWQWDFSNSDREEREEDLTQNDADNLSSGLQQLQNDLVALKTELAKMRESDN